MVLSTWGNIVCKYTQVMRRIFNRHQQQSIKKRIHLYALSLPKGPSLIENLPSKPSSRRKSSALTCPLAFASSWKINVISEACSGGDLFEEDRTSELFLRVQVPYNHILTQNLYYNYYYPKPKYLIIVYLDPLCWGYDCPRSGVRRCRTITQVLDVHSSVTIWGFPKIRGTLLGVPIIRVIVYWGLYWGPLFRETTIWNSTPEIALGNVRDQMASAKSRLPNAICDISFQSRWGILCPRCLS